MTTPHYWTEALTHLSKDPLLAPILQQFPTSILQHRAGSNYATLLRAIVGQQISVKAAAAIWSRFEALGPTTPEHISTVPAEQLRGVGLSGQKVVYIQAITHGWLHGTVHPHRWPTMTDEDVITELTSLKGVGRWTAEMYLIFHLQRPNVLPLADLGLLNAFQKTYTPKGLTGLTNAQRIKKLAGHTAKHAAKHWHPYSTVATWFLWRSLDPHEVTY